MSVQIIVCDACGRMASECECLIEFHKFGMTLHVCDECIDKAKELVDKARKEYDGLACSGCGEWIDGDLDCIGEADGPSFCHHCGGEFDGPLLCKRCGKLAHIDCGDMCDGCYWGEGEGNDEQ